LDKRPASDTGFFWSEDASNGSIDKMPPATGRTDKVFMISLRFMVSLLIGWQTKIIKG
jgi:hypothetical protein